MVVNDTFATFYFFTYLLGTVSFPFLCQNVLAATDFLCLNISFPIINWSIVLHMVLSDRERDFVMDFLFC